LDYSELETNSGREGDQRPAVALKATPCLTAPEPASKPSNGQQDGSERGAYTPTILMPGDGGEKALHDWLGWSRGRQYDIEAGAIILRKEKKFKL